MSLKNQALNGAVWTYAQQFGTQMVSFIVSIFLARILLPEEFGLIGMIAIFMSIGNTLFDGGMTSSLIRSNTLDNSDYSTVFIFNLIVSIGIYILVFLSAPYIANFYNQPILVDITRVYALSFVFSSLGSVQNTILTKNMQFRKQAMLTMPVLLLSSSVALIMAFNGFGVWSLVGMSLTNAFTLSVVLFFSSRWTPSLSFSREKFATHFGYGYKLTLSGILDVLFTNMYQVVIGKFFQASIVGYYTRANQLMMMPIGNVSTALNKVAFPLFSELQHDTSRLRSAYKRIMLLVLFVINPIIILMLILAKPLTIFLFTQKWLPMVPLFQILCLSGLLYPLHLYNLLILQVKGRSDLFLKLEVAKKILSVGILAVSFFSGIYGLLWGQVLFSILALFINTYYAGSLINYTMRQQLIDILPIFALSLVMCIIVYLIDSYFLYSLTELIRLILNSLIGFVIYIGISSVFKFESLIEIKNIIKRK